MSTRKRARRRRRSLRRNPLSTKQKLVGIGGIVIAGGVAAYTLMRSAPTPSGGAPTPDPRIAKQQECAALQAALADLRNQPTPNPTAMVQLEGQIATCLAQAAELGASVDVAVATLSAADASFAQIEAWWNEYKATSDHDPLKRNNTRQSILQGGAALAASLAEAVTQSPNHQATKLVAQSIVRALNSAITRRLCFLSNERGCGTFGANEDQPDAKAQQEQDRVISPLLATYAQAVAKVGGPSRALADADGEQFLAAILRPCAGLKDYIDQQFAHYRATSEHDPLKRNNTRQTILASGRGLSACLTGVFNSAQSFGSHTALRAVAALTLASLNASIDRWLCFFSNQQGCGTFGANEDQPDVKAAQENTATIVPLSMLYARIAAALVTRGDVTAYEPLVTAKLRIAGAVKAYCDAQFAHYRATSYSDPLKRNNTRQSILAAGASLAPRLADALTTALSAVKPGADRGLGQFIYMPLTSGALTPSLIVSAQAAQAAAPVPKVDVTRMIRPIAALTASAIDAAVQRKLCYLYDQRGCGRDGLNEDHGNDKAQQEQDRVISPLIVVYKNTVIADKDNAQAETPMVRALLREITTAKDYIDGQFAHFKATDYSDWNKRNNTRASILSAAQRLISGLRNARPTTPAGRALLRPVAQAALDASRIREACYRSGASGCDQQWGLFFEGSGGQKADQELSQITSPLAALIADRGPSGLGQTADEPSSIPTVAWVGLAVVGGVIAYSAFQKPVRRNSRHRRTSRRAA